MHPETLEELLLKDYGTIPKTIGMFLLKHNYSTLEHIEQNVSLTQLQVRDGISILIQKRIVRFFPFERVSKYFIDRDMLKRRLYFSIYAKFISSNFSAAHSKLFLKVLLNGTYKETEINTISEELLQQGIFKLELNTSMHKDTGFGEANVKKTHKLSVKFLIVNYEYLDQKIYENCMTKFVSKRYNDAASYVFKAILKCDTVSIENILKNLESTKVLICDKGAIVNDKDNVQEYLKYLVGSGIVLKGFDESRAYFCSSSKDVLKMHKICLILRDSAMRRIFNMIHSKPQIEDKDITIRSLLSVNKVKTSLLSLQRLGLVCQKCSGDYAIGPRIEHQWYVDLGYACLSMKKRIEREIRSRTENIDTCWNLNYYFENTTGDDNVWISDFISLSTDHLIFSME